jgi:hypothetical protein
MMAKQKMRAAAVSLFVILLPSSAMAQSLAGYWYGRGFQPEFHRDLQFIAHYREDGGFEVHFRGYNQNCVLNNDHREAGIWTMLDEHRIRIVTQFVGLIRAGPYVDDYDIEELTAQRLRVMWVGKNIEYFSTRVDAQFTFPDCEAVS